MKVVCDACITKAHEFVCAFKQGRPCLKNVRYGSNSCVNFSRNFVADYFVDAALVYFVDAAFVGLKPECCHAIADKKHLPKPVLLKT
jgi:hypothetical protein